MKVHIKNMVCDRCKMVVKAEFEKLGFSPIAVKLGEVTLAQEILSEKEQLTIEAAISKFGFSLLTSRKELVVAQVKAEVIELVHYSHETLRVNLSDHLSAKLNIQYATLSGLFSENTGSTIEKFFILQKIEKAKEMIAYGEKSLSEIAYLLNYSSVAHLSSQFKKAVGQTPSAYKRNQRGGRKSLDKI